MHGDLCPAERHSAPCTHTCKKTSLHLRIFEVKVRNDPEIKRLYPPLGFRRVYSTVLWVYSIIPVKKAGQTRDRVSQTGLIMFNLVCYQSVLFQECGLLRFLRKFLFVSANKPVSV